MIPPNSLKPKFARDDRLDIAARLYRAICAQYPERLTVLLDESGRIVAHSGYVGVTEVEAIHYSRKLFNNET